MSAPEDAASEASAARRPVDEAPCGCDEAVERLWEYVDSELGELDQQRVEAHLEACAPCLEEEHIEVVLKQLVRRCCKEEAPAALRLRIHEQLTVLRLRAGTPPEA
ncbi:mycothiol system anti-sigma-R factor [Cellulomonas xiejunii]|uniref:Mycothiol system anti-sigma-R factor n=1 Tax=Cellulomonas xiejunii TaxID=2968083 RepID=A0ABY5KUS8_9CELL|nr:mycothiol system anti-sigma-R factor [Cellulomonas xiejunii]MCC2315156.1 mycothiol system anti-sigma-R factor [Cellulomonas xiejunii]MCC2321702.1 mycothiol system anti-sigma-R factor [Cellulomonas xiejunii]UUI73012.1 mycothiol system anti-sigma-R factor [Cellulomonas xiejunii]